MSFGVGLGDIVLILQTCMSIYKAFKEKDETIENAHDRIEAIHDYVNTVISGLDDKFGGRDKYPKSEVCLLIVRKMDTKAKEVKRIFRKYREVETKPNWVSAAWSQLLYVAGSSTAELQSLITTLERHRDDLAHQYVALMVTYNVPSSNTLVTQPTLPSLVSARSDVNILFLDSENTGRSVVAQAYALLVSEWTRRTKHKWNIATIHSAGIDVKNECGLIEIRQNLPTKLVEGKELPSLSAQSALFDNKLFDHQYKADIRNAIGQRVSRGLGRSTFNNYDYIIVFTLEHLWAMKKLLSETKKKYPHLAPRGKAKFVVLGEYGKAGDDKNIWGPKAGKTPQQKKEFWIQTVSTIKVSFKGWLTKELDWTQPPKGAHQS